MIERHILKPLWGGFPSERWLLPDDDNFSAPYKTRLLNLIRDRFGVGADPELPTDCIPDRARQLRLKKNRELFYLVYRAVGETSPCPLTFNAHYGLFRVLLTMFGVLALVSLAGFAWAVCCRPANRLTFGAWTIFGASTARCLFPLQEARRRLCPIRV
ncbi:MAG: hypothetical protein N3G20_00535 [Verrucomicrobiae bacterium]|nr:hypothetical protein [Verrucomicrobiae bacterium]